MLRIKGILPAMGLAVILCGTAHAKCVCQTPEGTCYNGSKPHNHCACSDGGRLVPGMTTECDGHARLSLRPSADSAPRMPE